MRQVDTSYIEGNRKNKLLESGGKCSCAAKIHKTVAGSFLLEEHNHAPCPEKLAARKIIANGKNLLKENRLVSTAQAIGTIEALATAENLNASFLGSSSSLKRKLSRAKFSAHGTANLGSTLASLVIPPTLRITQRGDQFLLYDSNTAENRVIIFASADSLDKLAFCETWLIDGTFKSSPSLFAQIYTIHGMYRNSVAVPLVYAYLPGKSEAVYTELFRVLLDKINGEPQLIISDFELAAINACKETFTTTELNACLFHLTQNIFKHVQQIPEVYKRYKSVGTDSERVKTGIRSLGALAFVRPVEVVNAFLELRAQFPVSDPVREIFKYFQNTYLGYLWEDVRFPIPFWNVRRRFETNQPRTNNAKEGWHYRFNNLHPRSHPSMDTSIQIIQGEENHWFLECQKISTGYVSGRRLRSRIIDNRLREIIANHEAQVYHNHIEFLSAIQMCLHEFISEG